MIFYFYLVICRSDPALLISKISTYSVRCKFLKSLRNSSGILTFPIQTLCCFLYFPQSDHPSLTDEACYKTAVDAVSLSDFPFVFDRVLFAADQIHPLFSKKKLRIPR